MNQRDGESSLKGVVFGSIQNFLATIMVVFFISMSLIVFYTSATRGSDFLAALEKTFLVFGSIIGAIVGYYFGHAPVGRAKEMARRAEDRAKRFQRQFEELSQWHHHSEKALSAHYRDLLDEAEKEFLAAINSTSDLTRRGVSYGDLSYVYLDKGEYDKAIQAADYSISQSGITPVEIIVDIAKLAKAAALAKQRKDAEAETVLNSIQHIDRLEYLFRDGSVDKSVFYEVLRGQRLGDNVKAFLTRLLKIETYPNNRRNS